MRINKIETQKEIKCDSQEELVTYFTSIGDILNLKIERVTNK